MHEERPIIGPGDNRPDGGDHSGEFVRLLMAHRHRIYAYILTMVGDCSAAEDLMQDVSEVMWTKYASVRPVENFGAWAVRIAHNKILNYLTKKGRSQMLFSPDVLEDIASRAQTSCEHMSERIDALRYCMRKLSSRDRHFILLRYEDGKTIKDIARRVGRSAQGMYKTMARIHDVLLRCVRRRLATEQAL